MVTGAGGAGGSDHGLSRRGLLATALAGVGATAVAGCGSGSATPATPAPSGHERTDDVEILDGALGIEAQAIAAYEATLPRLRGADADLARRALAHERAHSDALATLIREFGATPSPAAASPPPARPGGRSQALSLLAGVENRAIAYYVDALPKLSGPFRHVMLGVVASEAEHLAALRIALGLPGAGQALLWGRP